MHLWGCTHITHITPPYVTDLVKILIDPVPKKEVRELQAYKQNEKRIENT